MSKLYLHHQHRIRNVINIILIFGLILIFRFFYIQILSAKSYSKNISDLVEYNKTIKGERGYIYDRNGIPLAENITSGDFWVNTNKQFNIEAISHFFFEYFNEDCTSTSNLLKNRNTNYLPIKKNVRLDDPDKIKEKIKKIKGLYLDEYNQRLYRYGDICSQLIGYVDLDGNGQGGIEQGFNSILKGNNKKEKFKKSIDHRLLNKEKEKFSSELYGKNIFLTIDINLQKILYEAIKKGQINSFAKSANGMILDPHTGEILAMAGFPSYDPNNYQNYDTEYFKNNVIAEQYEPGSTLKIIPILNIFSSSDIQSPLIFHCELGEYTLPGTNIIIHDHEPHEELTLDEILIYSSNIGISKISDILGKENIYNSLKIFGIGTKTGINLPGEENGFLRNIKKWSRVSHSMASMGQGISITNLQLAMIYGAIANDGYLLNPMIVNKIQSHTEEIVFTTEVIRKVISKKHSKKIIQILKKAVSEGTGNNAAIPGYDVAGKTGTAEKFINGEYSDRYFVSSFASIFPSDSPQYVCIVSVDSPEYYKHWGNMTAAPIVKDIYKEIIISDYLYMDREIVVEAN